MKEELKQIAAQCRTLNIEAIYTAELKQAADKYNARLGALVAEIGGLDIKTEELRGELLQGGKDVGKDAATLQGRTVELAAKLRLSLIEKRGFAEPVRETCRQAHAESMARIQEAREELEATLAALGLGKGLIAQAVKEDRTLIQLWSEADRLSARMKMAIITPTEESAIDRLEALIVESV